MRLTDQQISDALADDKVFRDLCDPKGMSEHRVLDLLGILEMQTQLEQTSVKALAAKVTSMVEALEWRVEHPSPN